jgi:hypothetical protein
MVGDFVGPAHSAKVNRIMAADQVFPVVRQHLAMALKVVPTGKVEVVKLQANVKAAGHGLQNPQPLGHDFFANAVPGNDSDAVCGHDKTPFESNDRLMGNHSCLAAVAQTGLRKPP